MAAAAAGDDECHQVVNSFDADIAGAGQDLGMAVCQHHGGHDEAGGKDEEAECRVEVRSNGKAGGVEDGGDRVGEENRELAGFEEV